MNDKSIMAHFSYPTLLFRHPLLPGRRPHTLQPLHMFPQDRHILLPQNFQRIFRTFPPIIKTMWTIPIRPSQKVGKVGYHVSTRFGYLIIIIVILGHDSFDAYQTPKTTPSHQIIQMRIQKPPQHQHEAPNNIRVIFGPPIPITMGRNRLKKRTMQNDEFNIHKGAIRLIKCIHTGRMRKRLVAIGNLLGTHVHPLVLSFHAIRPPIVLGTTRKTRPFDQHVFLPIIGTALSNDRLDECRIVDFGCRFEPPLSDFGFVEPSEETGLERRGSGIHIEFEAGCGIDLIAGEGLDDGDEAVVGGAFDS
mmetsp:Transcript_26829/g.49333  ORF Transcript_26829/g.49333 Transcript_26829/m.49333 type:complete len:305 (-) Transcript_26829:471-1385(-)